MISILNYPPNHSLDRYLEQNTALQDCGYYVSANVIKCCIFHNAIPYYQYLWSYHKNLDMKSNFQKRKYKWPRIIPERKWEGITGGKGWRVFRKNYKGHMDNTKGWWNQGREVGMAGVWGRGRKLYLNKIKLKKEMEKKDVQPHY